MKLSKFNLFIEKEDRVFVYNQLRSSLLEIDEDLFHAISMPNFEVTNLSKDILDELYDNGMVCEDSLCEENIILAQNKLRRFSGSFARVTILPTMDCNFHCWYCYEHHHESSMTRDGVESVIAFCKGLIEEGGMKSFQLDWFGGEPLLYFEEVVYPISAAVKKYCADASVVFNNTMTTNGYLVSEEMASKMNAIGLNSFQITLDGGKCFHNKTRFSAKEKNSYDTIVQNITMLCRKIQKVDMTVRINYTPKNLDSVSEIAESFPGDVREMIAIVPQMVWQYKNEFNLMEEKLKKQMDAFVSHGFKKSFSDLECSGCYAENMRQFVVNYDLSVFKCTARDFSEKYSIGRIDKDGRFIPKPLYFDYFVASSLESPKCLECHLLPSCLGACIQKKLEGHVHKCNVKEMEESVRNKVLLYISQMEKTER